MIIYQVTQGSGEWLRLRIGKPTASQFDRIITPGGKPCGASVSQRYINEILAELILGRPLDKEMTRLMERGKELEAEARRYYEFFTGRDDITEVGFCTSDDGRVGASPDALVGAEGLLEIKCPQAETHVGYLFSEDGVGGAYKPQVQGQLYVCEREWCDTISYYPGMPEALIRANRDEAYLKVLREELDKFLCRLDVGIEEITKRGWLATPAAALEEAEDPLLAGLGITDAELAAYMAEKKQEMGW